MLFFCPTLTPPGMAAAERVLSPDGFLLPGSPGKTCIFSKQLQLASLGQECSYNPYCRTSIFKHLAITFPLLAHIPSLSFMLYYTSNIPVPLLSYISLTHLHLPLTHPSHIHTPLNPLTILKFPHTFLSPLSLYHTYPLRLPFPSVICIYTVYVMLFACIQFTVLPPELEPTGT